MQDRSCGIKLAKFDNWEIRNNSFKFYAACHLTHPAVDAGRSLKLSKAQLASVTRIQVELARQVVGGKDGAPTSGLEGKFDLKFCVALALHGYKVSAVDFMEPHVRDEAVYLTASKVRVSCIPEFGLPQSRLVVDSIHGTATIAEVRVARGHPGNQMDWNDMWGKFEGLVRPVAGAESEQIFDELRQFGDGNQGIEAIRRLSALTGSRGS